MKESEQTRSKHGKPYGLDHCGKDSSGYNRVTRLRLFGIAAMESLERCPGGLCENNHDWLTAEATGQHLGLFG